MLANGTTEIRFKLHKLLNGSIIVLALLTVLEHNALTEWSALATILMTLGAHAVSETFSLGLAHEIAHKRRPTFSEANALLRSSLIVVAPGIVPALAFAAVSAGWLPLPKDSSGPAGFSCLCFSPPAISRARAAADGSGAA